jgi:hypothetical protein
VAGSAVTTIAGHEWGAAREGAPEVRARDRAGGTFFAQSGGDLTGARENETHPRTQPAIRRSDHNEAEAVHVLYIAGMGRSGSTLLCRTLGSVEGFFGTGELMRLICRGLDAGDFCGCGAPVEDCELWSGVLHDLSRRCPDLDLERLETTRRRVTEGWEFLRYLFVPAGVSSLERDLHEYRGFLGALYRSIRFVTGADIIVDASKNVFFAKLLTETPGVRVSFVHLVRDSRGVTHSWTRKTPRPGTNGRQEYFRQLGPFLGPMLWSAANLMAESLHKRAVRYVRVRYEDFIGAPSATVDRILRELRPERAVPEVAHVNGTSVRLGLDHLIASNPNRSQRGEIDLREDLAWRREMSASRRTLVTGLTLPLLRRYGYRALAGPAGDGIEVSRAATRLPER